MTLRRIALLLLFALLSVYAGLTVNRVVEPAMTSSLLVAAALGIGVGLPGLIDRRLALLTPVAFVGGLYLLMRFVSPLPPDVGGWTEHYPYYLQELRFGFSAYREAVFPLVLTGAPGLELLLAFWVFLVVSGGSILALAGNRPLAGTALLLALLAFNLTVDDSQRALWLASGFLLVVVLVLVVAEGQNRRSWGLGDLTAGLLIGAVAVGLAITTLQAAPGVAAGGWQDWRSWRPFGGGDREVVFNWRQNYPRLLDPENDFPVMRVASPVPSYWRANTLEVFTGDAWLSAGTFLEPLEENAEGDVTVPVGGAQPPGETVTQRFLLQALSTTYLFVGGEPVGLRQESGGRVYTSGYGALRAEIPLQPPSGYEVTAIVPEVTPAQLAGLGRDYPADIAELYLQLPLPRAADMAERTAAGEDPMSILAESGPRGPEFADLYALNDEILRGATDPYQIALRIERFLRNRYTYSLELPPSGFVSPYAAFLLDTRVGYCQQFAGSMTLLLRLNGVPARVAVGFTTGSDGGDGTYIVGTNNAHSWVEMYFPGLGWLPFDPTPGQQVPVAGASSTTPGFEDPFPREPLPEIDAPAAQGPLALPPGAGADPDIGEPAPGPSTSVSFRGLVPLLLIAAGLLAWPLLLSRARTAGARRGDPTARVRRSLELNRATLAAAGLPVREASTPDELARVIEEELGLDASPVRVRAQEVLYGNAPPTETDLAVIETVRREAWRRAARRRGWVWTVVSWYVGPRQATHLAGVVPTVFGRKPAVRPVPHNAAGR